MAESKSVLVKRGLAWAIDSFLVLFLISVVVIFTAERYDVPDSWSEKEACSQFSDSSDNCLVVLDEALVFDLGVKSPINITVRPGTLLYFCFKVETSSLSSCLSSAAAFFPSIRIINIKI